MENTYTQEEIIKAVRLIKEICKSEECHYCPFCDGEDGCGIQNVSPCDWVISGDEPEIWRALL